MFILWACFLLLVTRSSASSELTCGTSSHLSQAEEDGAREVVGGREAQPGELPWQVELLEANSGRHRCGGSLISDRYIITAAHCLFRCRQREPVEVVALVGGLKLGEGRRYELEQVAWHENYCQEETNSSGQWFDIGLLRTREPVAMRSTEANTVCLPENKAVDYEPGELFLVSGWGRTDLSSPKSLPEKLQVLQVKHLEEEQCLRLLENHRNRLQRPGEICAIGDGPDQSHCRGDSGGPLTRLTDAGSRELVGIVSRSADCGSTHLPAIFTRVADHLDWIKANLED